MRRTAATWAELAKAPLVEDQLNASGGDYSQRRACRLVGIDPKTWRYAPRHPDAALLIFATNRKSAMHHPDAGVLGKFLVQDSMVAGAGFEPAAFRL
nr:hypothetical protein [Acetobacter orleanensis]